MVPFRIIHYLNQFFAGQGGEDQADLPVQVCPGPLGPGKRLQGLLEGSAEIAVTVYCGDNYFPAHRAEALEGILRITREEDIQIVVAGPAFAAGRYGFACVEVCHFLSTSLGLDCVTGIHPKSPALEGFKQYRDRRVFALPTAENVSGMEKALGKMAGFIRKLSSGASIGSASEEGYLPHGIRLVEVAKRRGVERALDMLLDKLGGRSFSTEIPVSSLQKVSVAPPIMNFSNITVALATTAGVVEAGNPDGFKTHRNTKWKKYSIAGLNSMQDKPWEVRHGGYNTLFMLGNANYSVPLDVCRDLEKKGLFGKLSPHYYSSPGQGGEISVMEGIGQAMASDMKAEGVGAVLLVST